MIDFESELSNFDTVKNIDEVESAIESDELRDILDLLNYICIKINKG